MRSVCGVRVGEKPQGHSSCHAPAMLHFVLWLKVSKGLTLMTNYLGQRRAQFQLKDKCDDQSKERGLRTGPLQGVCR